MSSTPEIVTFKVDGREVSCSIKAKLLVERSRGTSSYQLVGGFSATDWERAVRAYDTLPSGNGDNKRIMVADNGKHRCVIRAGGG